LAQLRDDDFIVECDHPTCKRQAIIVRGDVIIVWARHHGEWHNTTIPITKLFSEMRNGDAHLTPSHLKVI